ncbi:selenocysteine-specific translation elongation factor [Desulfosoma caldarium]|uniref:Selenocysteine-specific elongation factor n=1 Tax=Desulfosoma caldarium TaxID=610254 RepID=A0A3N1UZC9_9BACT|nr:selenocysteine-specific translation elongation factor [Desulfosoma caldarium]ROQ93201.1 selenocysteine-specific elongation factor [Desulfosoma caldarium]
MLASFTIGIAGHVDHGKTSLVKALTGWDTDRLAEEKRRGLTIEPGVAPLVLPNGRRVALMDVPGHKDFLKNTIRGLSSVQAAVLVVAADDGIMPQTLDHLEILHFMGAKTGMVVLSKADLVDEETLELAEMEVRDLIKGTFLDGCVVVPFSALQNRGLAQVLKELERLVDRVTVDFVHPIFRLWIDRVIQAAGFGTVVSGTVLCGALAEGDPVEILPTCAKATARFLEVHHERVPRVEPGMRAGINLRGVPFEAVAHGMALITPGYTSPAFYLNAQLEISRHAPKPLRNQARVKIHLGTGCHNALVVLMDQKSLNPGETGLVQLRMEKPVPALARDPFVMCSLDLEAVLGGGTVLEVSNQKFRERKATKILPFLECLLREDVSGATDMLFQRSGNRALTLQDMTRATGFSSRRIADHVNQACRQDRYVLLGQEFYLPKAAYRHLIRETFQALSAILAETPLKAAVTAQEIKHRVDAHLDDAVCAHVLDTLVQRGMVARTESGYRLPEKVTALPRRQQEIVQRILDYAHKLGWRTFAVGTFCDEHGERYSRPEVQKLVDYLTAQKTLVRLRDGRYMTRKALEQIKERVRDKILRDGSLTIADCSQLFGFGRTRGISILDYLDSIGMTMRVGDRRVLSDQYAQTFWNERRRRPNSSSSA